MKQGLTFDDVLLVPKFTDIKSRRDVSLNTKLANLNLKIPIISSNMDTVTGEVMAQELGFLGAGACLHRFCTIEENVQMFNKSPLSTICSIGVSDQELERALALNEAGCNTFIVDVAWGASQQVVDQVRRLKAQLKPNTAIGVGNFVDTSSLQTFLLAAGHDIDFIKVGVGNGANCKTRLVTGVGYPQLSAIMECSELAEKYGLGIIADGGVRTTGDIAKALAAGATAVMTGRLFAGTREAPGELTFVDSVSYKTYRGSASLESYKAQGKVASWRAAEGGNYLVIYKGSVKDVISEIEGGLRSALTYLNAYTLTEFRKNATFIQVTSATVIENGLHEREK